jgi:GntR family transcriptional regulator
MSKVATKRSQPPSKRDPKYLAIYNALRTRLETGEFAINSILPTEDELCDEYEVTRYALREALNLLERQGFIQRRRRAGTRVLGLPVEGVFRHGATSREELEAFAKGTTITFGAPTLVQTDAKLARFLACDEFRQW